MDGLQLRGCLTTFHISRSALKGLRILSGVCDMFKTSEWYSDIGSIGCGVLDGCEGFGDGSC